MARVAPSLKFPTLWSLVPSLILLTGCGAGSQPPFHYRRLSSGEQVKVLGIGKVNFGAIGPALMLKYQTDLNMDDEAAVHAEAQRIWAEFRKDADQAQVQSAIVSANSPPSGGGAISHTRAYNFVFERRGAGEWHEISQE
jgi:hypothetical protein